MTRLPADAAHQFGGIELDRARPLSFRLNGHRIDGFVGDTVLSAVLASGIDSYGMFGDAPLALTELFAPLAAAKGGEPLPISRLAAADGLDLATPGAPRLGWRKTTSLVRRIDGIPEPSWLRADPAETLATDLLIVGGGVAGLAAADSAAAAGRSVIVAERRPWLGGDSRYFGPVGDEDNPEAVVAALVARLAAHPNVTILTRTEIFALHGTSARAHIIDGASARIVAITARRVLLATGGFQRLPLFAGNRIPGVMSSISAYHLAKRYGVVRGASAVVATQSNFGYRLALRLNDAGTAIRRIIDVRVNPQSRFVDFAKASGLTLAGGQLPLAASPAKRHGLHLSFANAGTNAPALELAADRLIVSGPFQPDLALWMLAGGGSHWSEGKLVARGRLDHVALAGFAAGYRSLRACLASGRAAQAAVFGETSAPIDDHEIGAPFETPEAPATIAPPIAGAPAFFDSGSSLIARPMPSIKPMLTAHAHAPSLGDVAASVELGLTSPADAGTVAEERGAPGADLVASVWTAPQHSADDVTAWLAARFGDAPVRLHLVVDDKRRFERGALVYANVSRPDPVAAIGVIIAPAPDGKPGAIALIEAGALRKADRFIVETLDGPSPARIAPA